jgi:hypothetical protein
MGEEFRYVHCRPSLQLKLLAARRTKRNNGDLPAPSCAGRCGNPLPMWRYGRRARGSASKQAFQVGGWPSGRKTHRNHLSNWTNKGMKWIVFKGWNARSFIKDRSPCAIEKLASCGEGATHERMVAQHSFRSYDKENDVSVYHQHPA